MNKIGPNPCSSLVGHCSAWHIWVHPLFLAQSNSPTNLQSPIIQSLGIDNIKVRFANEGDYIPCNYSCRIRCHGSSNLSHESMKFDLFSRSIVNQMHKFLHSGGTIWINVEDNMQTIRVTLSYIRKLTNLCCPFGTFQGFFASWKEKSAKRWKAPCPFCPFCFHLYIYLRASQTSVTHWSQMSHTVLWLLKMRDMHDTCHTVHSIIHHASIWYICLEFDEIDFKKNDFYLAQFTCSKSNYVITLTYTYLFLRQSFG